VRSTNNNFIRSLDHSRDPRVCFEMFRDITDELFAAGRPGTAGAPCDSRGSPGTSQPAKRGLTGGLS
jgi:hypothetical protein